jgi:hypothetical protein
MTNALGLPLDGAVIGEQFKSHCFAGVRFARKVDAKQCACYQGATYHFPDALPGEIVFFADGQPVSDSAVAIPRDRFGFDVWPESSAASPRPFHSLRHTAHNPRRTSHWGSWNICRGLGLVVAKIAQALLREPQSDRIARTGAAALHPEEPMTYQDKAAPSASDDDNADIHK